MMFQAGKPALSSANRAAQPLAKKPSFSVNVAVLLVLVVTSFTMQVSVPVLSSNSVNEHELATRTMATAMAVAALERTAKKRSEEASSVDSDDSAAIKETGTATKPKKTFAHVATEKSHDREESPPMIGWHTWCEKVNKVMVSKSSEAPFWTDKYAVKQKIQALLPNLRHAKAYAKVTSVNELNETLFQQLISSYSNTSNGNDEFRFLMKPTHTSGRIVLVKTNLTTGTNETACLKHMCKTVPQNHHMVDLQRTCQAALEERYGNEKGELWYTHIEPACILEEVLPQVGSKDFLDYKIWVMNGQVQFVEVNGNRYKQTPTRTFFTPQGHYIPMNIDNLVKDYFRPMRKMKIPSYWNAMMDNAQTISQAIFPPPVNATAAVPSFARIDFFGFKTGYAFAEITFAPGSCERRFLPVAAEAYFGFVQTNLHRRADPEKAPGLMHFLQLPPQKEVLQADAHYRTLFFSPKDYRKAREAHGRTLGPGQKSPKREVVAHWKRDNQLAYWLRKKPTYVVGRP
eukprot:CAMPEP_0172463130 /NCGR_PEP_ID=MMETSP1065-20121228/46132_1 /TAXON_ID=265537 /ORGANISM="Amphiprora paludosa, Strain CCMP125" /LENGTH=514 /DNA_ID=CAMNT_0013219003 /DNA_START=119 /DNA_END=1663 /DNA_ORIENTATION=+